MKKEKIRYYHSFDEDFIESKEQNYKLDADYKWLRHDILSKFLSVLIYTLALIFSSVYCHLFLHLKFKNRKALRGTAKSGAFIYANHTQPVGDVFCPALAAFPNRIYTLVSPANLGIPFIGKILPYLGALPIADNIKGIKKLNEAIEYRLEQNRCIVIFPEAHVWEYCTFIRPFGAASFKFPVKYDKPVFCLTATYQKRKFGKKPKMTIYADGPFYADKTLSPKEQAADLQNRVSNKMKERSANSNCEYIKYRAE